MQNKIYLTNDLEFLKSIKFINGNREVKKNTELFNKISEVGIRMPLMFTELDGNTYVIDGQHRLTYAMELLKSGTECNVPYFYNQDIHKGDIIEEIYSLNSVNKQWSVKNLVDAKTISKDENYIILNELTQKASGMMSYTFIAGLLNGFYRDNPTSTKSLKNGTFKTDEASIKRTEYIIDKLINISNVVSIKKSKVSWYRSFVVAVLSSDYDEKRMLDKLSSYWNKYENMSVTGANAIDYISEIYNYHQPNGTRKDLFKGYIKNKSMREETF